MTLGCDSAPRQKLDEVKRWLAERNARGQEEAESSPGQNRKRSKVTTLYPEYV